MNTPTLVYSTLLIVGLLLILFGVYTGGIAEDLFGYSFVLGASYLLNTLNLTTSSLGKSNKLDVVLNLVILITSIIAIIPLIFILRLIYDFGGDDFKPICILLIYFLTLSALSAYHIGLPLNQTKDQV